MTDSIPDSCGAESELRDPTKKERLGSGQPCEAIIVGATDGKGQQGLVPKFCCPLSPRSLGKFTLPFGSQWWLGARSYGPSTTCEMQVEDFAF